ncbi:MAG: hypothetical protein AB8B91_12080 [Rubripirellula sp.]
MLSESPDRIVLLNEYLGGNEEARAILADLLDEEREPGLASWARAPVKTVYKRLDFVLATLPYMLTLRLSSEYYLRALEQIEAKVSLSDGLDEVVQWTELVQCVDSEGAAELMNSACGILSRVCPDWSLVPDINRSAQQLHAAARCAESAANCALAGDGNSFRRLATESKNAARKVAKAARDVTRPRYGFNHMRVNQESSGQHAGWQLKHCHESLSRTLRPADESG